MAHCFYIPPPPPISFRSNNPYLKTVSPLPQPQAEVSTQASNPSPSSATRNGSSTSPSDDSIPTSPTTAAFTSTSRRDSALSVPRNIAPIFNASDIKTRTFAFGPGLLVERDHQTPPSPEEIIIVTVRLSNKFRRTSISGAENLPDRETTPQLTSRHLSPPPQSPPPRTFLRRLSTRMARTWDHSAEREERYKALRMPRGEYEKFFRRDGEGNYAGTEVEREWDEEDLMRMYGVYQGVALFTVVW